MILSVLIPTLPQRKKLFDRLMNILMPQISGKDHFIQVLINPDKVFSIGKKRNALLQDAKGRYVCFIDDDDRVSNDYIKLLVKGITHDPDCCSLNGIITTDALNAKTFKHSIDYDKYEEVNGVYLRYPNHLNCIKAEIAKQFRFPDKSFSEDTEWATQLHQSGLLKTEYKIEKILYYYDFVSNKEKVV